MNLPALHRWSGGLALLTFLATGVHLRLWVAGAPGMVDAVRWLYRANHIYLLLAGLLNLGIGLYGAPAPRPWRRRLQSIGSLLLLASLPLLALAFFLEPPRPASHRPLTTAGVLAATAGTLLQIPARRTAMPGSGRP